jgi:hypothetical protein
MGWRFRRTIRLLPGVRLNLSKSGISTSLGGPGATLNLGKHGARATFGLPGTGLSYSTRLGAGRPDAARTTEPAAPASGGRRWGCLAVAGVLAGGLALIALLPEAPPAPPAQTAPTASADPVLAPVTRIVVPATLNCRDAPSTTAAIARRLTAGEQVRIATGRRPTGPGRPMRHPAGWRAAFWPSQHPRCCRDCADGDKLPLSLHVRDLHL